MLDNAQLASLPAEIRDAIAEESLYITAEISHRSTYVIMTYASMSTTLDPDDVVAFEIHEQSSVMHPETRVFTTTYASSKIHESYAYDALSQALQAVAAHHRETYAVPAEHDPSLLDRH
jgi:hypothetical protein